MVPYWKTLNYFLFVGTELLPRVKEYLWVLLTSGSKMEHEVTFRWIGAASPVMLALQTVVVKSKLSGKAKLSTYQSLYIPNLTYGHKLWIMTERMRLRLQSTKMTFFCRGKDRAQNIGGRLE